MTRNEAIKFVILRSFGNFLVLFSLYGIIVTFGPALTEELKVLIIQTRGVHFKIKDDYASTQCHSCEGRNLANNTGDPRIRENDKKNVPSKDLSFTQLLSGSKQQIMIPIDPEFSVLIPKLGANVKVFPNIDPNNSQEYLPVLQKGVAHAKGSVFPGQSGVTYLFAHSADNWWDVGRYNAVFYTLNNLSKGDEIDIFFENTRYRYQVSEKIISDPEDTTLLASQHTGPQRLVLQTCWPPGTTLKRLYVIAKPARVGNKE
ncbi:MAG: sortase [Candidatus Levyibacteriota bacterium]